MSLKVYLQNKGGEGIKMSEWQISLTDRMRHLFYSKKHSDCQFEIKTKSSTRLFKSHKLLMAMASPVFDAMLYGPLAEQNKPIVIEDIEAEVFEGLLEFVYTDNVNLPSSDYYYDLYYAAKKYMLPTLEMKCIRILGSNINVENAFKAYEFAKVFEETILMNRCLEFIKNETTRVLDKIKLEDLQLSTILTLLDQDVLNIQSERVLFDIISLYTENNMEGDKPEEHQSLIQETLKKVRFLTMTPQEFAEGPALSNLLTESEKLAIFINISSPVTDVSMPSGFSTSTKYRNSPWLKRVKLWIAPRPTEKQNAGLAWVYKP